jgi:tetratricopeptide (TPR) repeat protein
MNRDDSKRLTPGLSSTSPPDECASVVSPTPAQDLDLARQAIKKGEIHHAAHHLACVVALDPKRPGLAEAIAAWMKLSDTPLSHVDVTNGIYYGVAALRAMVLARLGDSAGAVLLLLQVLAAKPDAPFLDLVGEWLTPPVARALPPAPALASMLKWVQHDHLRVGLFPLVQRIHEAQPAEGQATWLLSRLLRMSGKAKEALALLTEVHPVHPSYFTAIGLAAARKETGDVEGCIAANEEALQFRADDIGVRLDLGDTHLELGRFDAARAAYAAVLEQQPNHDWAHPSLVYLDVREGKLEAVAALEALARDAKPGTRAAVLFDRVRPYVLSLTPPSSSIVNAIVGALQRNFTPKKFGVSSLEPASVVASVNDLIPGIAIDFAEVPSPDPRKPRRKLPFKSVWTYEASGFAGILGGIDLQARPGVAPPAEEVMRAIATIASSAFNRAAWAEAAQDLGARLGPDAVRAILGAMAYPGPRPEGMTPWDWRFRVQVVAALTLLGVDRGWTNSARQRAFFTLLYGPVDWATTAALVAMTELACRVPEQRKTLADIMLEELEGSLNPIRYSCIVEPLLGLLPQVPLESEQRARFEKARRRLAG